MKGHLEKVPQRIGASWRYRKVVEETKSYGWHRHKEYEIAIHRHFEGRCFIGHHEVEICHNNMVLVGPNLPHAIYADKVKPGAKCETHIIWFRKEWIDQLIISCHELEPLKQILKDASQGVLFSPHVAENIVQMLTAAQALPAHQQLFALFNVLGSLIDDKDRRILSNPIQMSNEDAETITRVERAEAYLQQHYAQSVTASDLANHLFISESSVRRLFQKHYSESYSQRLKKIRLNVACDLLMNTDLPINLIVEQVGYDNQSNFNRQFKTYKRVTPREYRNSTKHISKRGER